MKSPLISCIITSYNQPDWLQQAIQSVLAQTYQSWELFVMDDNSSDKRIHSVLKEVRFHPRVRIWVSDVQAQERMTLCRYSHLINIALPWTHGKYITYLTDDDYYMPQRFELMERMLRNDHIHTVYGTQMLKYGDDQPHGYRFAENVLDDAYDIVDHNSVMHCRHVYEEVGGWTESPEHWRGADGQYWRKITGAGYKFYPVQAVTDVHRFHTGSVRHKLLEQGLTDLN